MLPWLDPNDDSEPFPNIETALDEPNGLLAAGGSLSPTRLLNAYEQGIFPWFDDDQPILWWSPDPRLTIKPKDCHVSKSLKKVIKKDVYHCTVDKAFDAVIHACASPRIGESEGTWITSTMIQAYSQLHTLGHAHSVEVWEDNELVGGLYGIAIGQVFFGESMFSRKTNASKVGFTYLCQRLDAWGYQLIDCQVESDHLFSLGAVSISRDEFLQHLATLCSLPTDTNAWKND